MSGSDIERARYMLKTAAGFILRHASDRMYLYDEAMCDGHCLADDCIIAAESLTELATIRSRSDEMEKALRAAREAMLHVRKGDIPDPAYQKFSDYWQAQVRLIDAALKEQQT